MLRKILAGIAVVFSLFSAADAQNIVEIFGKEKIQTIEEGDVFYQFQDGLSLRGRVNPGYIFDAQDVIGWQYASGTFQTPRDGDSLESLLPAQEQHESHENVSKPNESDLWKWTAVQANDKAIFEDLRSAYLYTSCNIHSEQTALLETTGGTRTYINGILYEGDHYDYGWMLTPVLLKAGLNEFISTPGRFGRISSRLIQPRQEILLTQRDMFIPDLLMGEKTPVWAAVRVINMTSQTLRGYSVKTTLTSGESHESPLDDVIAMSVRKLKYQLPALASGKQNEGKTKVKLELLDPTGQKLDQIEYEINIVSPLRHHTRTFISSIDGSVQFFSVQPALRMQKNETTGLALTTHGASVDARVQAGCYLRKDWLDIVAATNRRPFGFNWEDWGRLDALEVLAEAKRIYQPNAEKIYLTGHSMGGHGAWYLGTTYPELFAAIAPCAGYPDRVSYVAGSDDDNAGNSGNPRQETHSMYKIFDRSANEARLLKRIENLKSLGVYIFHGEVDTVVPTRIARMMREVLAKFHSNFCYYEYPNGSHWFGTQCMDWFPIFEFFARHKIPSVKDVKHIDFRTMSPGVSPSDFWVRIEQQEKPFEMSHIQAERQEKTITIHKAENITLLVLDIPSLIFLEEEEKVLVKIGNQEISVPAAQKAILSYSHGNGESDGEWKLINTVDPKQKNSKRYGGFKDVINNHVVFVYATGGTPEETEWFRSKARFDADTFYYRGNGSIDIIPDTEYSVEKYAGRNVLLYGTSESNKAWKTLLSDCPIQVKRGEIQLDSRKYTGDDLGIYFVFPHPKSDNALVGVVAGTGESGIRAAYPNNYISSVTGFPDFVIFRSEMLRSGLEGIEAAGYFSKTWTLTNKDYSVKAESREVKN
jgi:pimeloyl-ACP methyl ester carboxylesterase